MLSAGHVLLQRTPSGRHLFSVGSNEEATRLSGVPVARVKLLCYTLCGLLAGLTGMLYTGYVGFAVAFAFAGAAMLEGKLDQTWARWTRPWTTTAWAFLSMGIGRHTSF